MNRWIDIEARAYIGQNKLGIIVKLNREKKIKIFQNYIDEDH